MSVLLEIHELSKIYNYQPNHTLALNNVSLTIYKGEVFGLLGVNGAGKTTLSSLIGTVHPPTSGDIVWNGVSIYKNLINYRQILGLCPQRPNFDPLLSVEQNLIFAGHYYLMTKKEITARVEQLVEQFDLGAYLNSSVSMLSGGYKQRLLIARALMHRPQLVILDEPTVGLDPHIRHQLWHIVRELRKEGTTVILTTHYLDEAEALSDRVCILDKGRIRVIDTPANIMSTYNKDRLEDVFLQLAYDQNNNKGA